MLTEAATANKVCEAVLINWELCTTATYEKFSCNSSDACVEEVGEGFCYIFGLMTQLWGFFFGVFFVFCLF